MSRDERAKPMRPELRSAAIRASYHVATRERLMESMAENAAGQPSAQNAEQDRTSGHETRLHCWEHKLDVGECRRDGRWSGDSALTPDERAAVPPAQRRPCTGEVIPAATDPAGEAAVTSDRVRSDVTEVRRLERQLIDTADRLAVIHARYLPTVAIPTDVKTKIAQSGLAGCESCDRLDLGGEGWFSEANYNSGRPTNFGGALPKRMILCRSCAEWALDHDHDHLCLDDNGEPRKGHPHYPDAIHLPPVRGQLPQTLAKKREYGRWAGKKAPKAA